MASIYVVEVSHYIIKANDGEQTIIQVTQKSDKTYNIKSFSGEYIANLATLPRQIYINGKLWTIKRAVKV